ncbi:MAG: ABC transporter permease [Candidatus Aenigmarchaeota archaeon]|nr:ABC transporter permease [Candidatus Aenigmarchaeota archaeon]
MKLSKCFKHALNMVLHSKLRSWLTITGIVIGVAAVIAIMSLGEGLQQSMDSQLSGLGGDILTLTAGASKGTSIFGMRGGSKSGFDAAQATDAEVSLTRTDVQALRGISDIALIDTNIRGNVDVSYLGKTGSVSLTGVDQKVWSQITTSKIKEGRMLDSADQNVVIIGGRLASTYFDRPIGINKMITIEDSVFRVVGVLDDTSTNVYMPISMAYRVLEEKETGVYDSIIIKVRDEELLNETITKIDSKLMAVRHVTEKTKDFTITSNKQIQDARTEALGTMKTFLLAIAAVSLLVGAIGVANTMFTSVLEKTKEIGIMKAIGARNRDILLIFLFNAGLIGFIGGTLGVLFGAAISSLMASLTGAMPMAKGGTLVTLDAVAIALFVSVAVGIISGLIPAYQASKLKPVDALRFE